MTSMVLARTPSQLTPVPSPDTMLVVLGAHLDLNLLCDTTAGVVVCNRCACHFWPDMEPDGTLVIDRLRPTHEHRGPSCNCHGLDQVHRLAVEPQRISVIPPVAANRVAGNTSAAELTSAARWAVSAAVEVERIWEGGDR